MQIGRYRVLGELGKGAMGIVYKAQDPAIGRTVAIKTIRLSDLTEPAERERLRDRLFREAQSAGILSHPNIVTIYDILEEEGTAYIFMEFVNGPALERVLSDEQPPPRDSLLAIFAQTAAALDYAHRKGIVHRDIKPANIMIDDDGAAKITDFGVAKIVSQQMTQAGALMGTPNYMSPEQVQGLAIDGRADQFALAVIAYEVLTGEKPFTGEYTPLLYKICREEPAPARQLNPSLNAEVDRVLQRGLAKAPDQRYPTCSEFVADLQKALAASPAWKPLPRGTSLQMETIAAAGAANRALPPVPPPPARRDESESHLVRNAVLAAIAFVAVGIVFLLAQRWASPTNGPGTSAQANESQPPAIQAAANDVHKPSALVKPEDTKPSPAQPTADSTAEDRPAEGEKRATPRPQIAPPAEPVMAEFNSVPPGAKVIVDNNPALSCQAPCAIALEPGRHVVRATAEGYRNASRIMVTPADTKLTVAMEQASGTLSVISTPPGATIILNGQTRPERTPAVIKLPPGAYRLQVKLGRVETEEETVEIRDSGISQRMYTLQ